ncbi:MAG: NADPH:quinone reductase [Betaproteobacteria bacterium]|nr:NADPH:quinone reductase [Betaproteobacteria bacterium]NCX81142.1 NADPH:quinone reductase [Betaproteobacteria bacterium]NDA05242.1 NADPH:quinone reductase [Betaproteobacteria bacterium]NDG13284.1 NADPH:quinone reductase [Betaproteobacteria bacterium]NDH29101.1 NADPH:quinone reductase [Betaproteobacteria bacterium]
MQAAFYTRKGPAAEVLQVGELDVPEPSVGEVRVRIKVSAVNPSDTKNRGGHRGNNSMPFTLIIPHQDGSGVIDAVGEGVSPERIGERVWVYEATLGRALGTCAQYCCVPASNAVVLPDCADFEAGACMGIPAMTAHRCVFADGSVRGKRVLVLGGAGAVGFYAVQMAKLDGAQCVIATVSRQDQAQAALRAGADHVINYREEPLVQTCRQLLAEDNPIDRVIDVAFGVNLAHSLALLRARGVIATYASDAIPEPSIPFWPMLAKDLTVRFVLVYAMGDAAHREAESFINQALAENKLHHQIYKRYQLHDVISAHQDCESMKILGKVLIHLD